MVGFLTQVVGPLRLNNGVYPSLQVLQLVDEPLTHSLQLATLHSIGSVGCNLMQRFGLPLKPNTIVYPASQVLQLVEEPLSHSLQFATEQVFSTHFPFWSVPL